jgi:pimeloyl-ACP methyl ester carboxylesterase
MRLRSIRCGSLLLALALGGAGCGSFVARRMAQAPNSYPTWLAPEARVMLDFSPDFLTNFPPRYLKVGTPAARLRYRIVEPADYQFKVSTNHWVEHGKEDFTFTFKAVTPGAPNRWSAAPRGTVVLLHGYGVAQFAMAPWALRLAEDGWRCVLVDLRGHGKSTGKRIFFGVREADDLSALLDELSRNEKLARPVAAVGESYGGALALRWKGTDSRVGPVVAIAPYAELAPAVINIGRDYAGWVPEFVLRAGLKKLPSVLEVQSDELDTTSVLERKPVAALLVAGSDDEVAPLADVTKLLPLVKAGSRLVIVPHATHEALTYFFDDLTAPVIEWLDGNAEKEH